MRTHGSIQIAGTGDYLSRNKTHHGFTLIEILIVLVLLSIFSVLAYGSYSRYILEARRVEGAGLLLEAGTRMEQFMAENGRYTNNMTQLGFGADPIVSRTGVYRVDAAIDATGQTFSLTAVRAAQQAADIVCGDLTLSSLGVKSAINNTEPTPAKNCWE